jgi:hypothetical protein
MPFWVKKSLMRKEFPMNIRSNNQMRTVLGITYERIKLVEFEFEKVLLQRRQDLYFGALEEDTRTRLAGGGRKPKLLTTSEKLSFCLYYLKAYPKFEDLANRFDLSLAAAHNNLHSLLPLLCKALGNLGVLPAREFANAEDMRAFLKKKGLTPSSLMPQSEDVNDQKTPATKELCTAAKRNVTPSRTPLSVA